MKRKPLSFGLYDLDRKIRPAGLAYRDLARTWSGLLSDDGDGLAQAVGF